MTEPGVGTTPGQALVLTLTMDRAPFTRALAGACSLVLLCGCGAGSGSATAEAATDTLALYVSPTSGPLAQNPELVAKLAGGVHEYYRFINVPFSEAVCRTFADVTAGLPSVTLHGDAHLEQFAVTDAGHGLTDFDDISEGPAVIDLVRFGVSLRLAAGRLGFDDAPAQKRFLEGYRQALDDPDSHPPEPPLVARLEARFEKDPRVFLDWADGLMAPVGETVSRELADAMAGYAREQLETERDLSEDFFHVKRAGSIGLGIGSALDEKYLFRIEGDTSSDDDDVVIEAKEVRDLARIPCIRPGAKADPFRVLVGKPQVPYRAHLGFFEMHGKRFWVHAWIANYQELDIDSLKSSEELAAVAYEAGLQLGRAHFADVAPEDAPARRREQRAVLDRLEPRIEAAIDRMSGLTLRAWDRFRHDATTAGVAVAP